MEIIVGIDNLRPFNNPVVALGNFDGVHLGHQKIFERAREIASRIGGESVIITFEPHPLKVLSPSHCPPLLTPFQKKMLLMERSGVKTVFCIEFTEAFSRLTPVEFVRDTLLKHVNPRKIIVGYNYHFGQRKSGNVETLQTLCRPFQVEVEIVEPFVLDGLVVSSSRIRELIRRGKMEEASRLLGRDYIVIGKVIEGKKRGQMLGFPTANLEITEELYPADGVYASRVIWNHRAYWGVANVGTNPTFQNADRQPRSLEVHLLDFNQMIYGERIEVSFDTRIRDEIRFESPGQLIEQIRKDIEWAKEKVFQKLVLVA